jgi:hypothetical protein
VDPLDQNRDIHNVIDYLIAAPMVVPRGWACGVRVGSGHVLHVAGNDARVKAVVSQVPGVRFDTHGFTHCDPEDNVSPPRWRGEIDIVPRSPDMPIR